MLRVGERLALIEAGGGGVLVDLEGGAFFRVNASALRACAALVRGAGVRELVEAGVAEVVAAAEVAAVEAALASAPPPGHARSPVVMRARADGWELYAAGRARLAIARGRLRALGATAGNADAVAVLVWAAPHLLALVGIDVLHASANLAAGAAHVWSGLSGAGKTTFARALATAGAPVLAEDVVVLRGDAVLADGERRVRAWAAAQAAGLAAGAEVESHGVVDALAGAPELALAQVGFVSAARSAGASTIGATALAPADAVARLLENGFAELGTREVFLRVLARADAIAAAVPLAELAIPDGLDALAAAAPAWAERLLELPP